MIWQKRNFLLGVASIAYVAFANMRASGRPLGGALSLVLLPLALAAAWSLTEAPRRGDDPVDPKVRSAARAGLFGAALLLAARASLLDEPSLNAAANLGAGIATVAALFALARIAPAPGALPLPRGALRLDAAWLTGLAWSSAALVSLAAAVDPSLGIEPLHEEIATSSAALASLLVVFAAIVRVNWLRQLELGVSYRSRAALTVSVLVSAIGATAALFRLSPPDWALQFAGVAISLLVALVCIARDPIVVARAHRLLLVAAISGAPLTFLAASVARSAPATGPLAVIAASLACLAIGLLAPRGSRPLEREQSPWLEAIERAEALALLPSPDRAVIAALEALREAAGQAERAPSLFLEHPAEVLEVDHGGYLHARKASFPASALEAALEEPERTLRVEVLEAVEVRRPDLRQALAFMRAEEAMTATALRLDGEATGLLVLPRGQRTSPLTLEEARALRRLTDRLASALETSAAFDRARARELDERARADREEDEKKRLESLLQSAGALYRSDARRLARPALAAAYSPASRLLLDELSRLSALGMPIALVAPLGTFPVSYAAAFHLGGVRSDKPFVVADGANPEEQPLALWMDPSRSKLAFADSGTLVVTSVEALPLETQEFLAHSLASRSSPSGRATPLDLGLVVSVIAPVEALVADGRLHPKLADRLGRSLALPTLADRPEDLRALTLERLARIGLRLRGEPMGIDARALALFVEHGWPGNELELEDVLSRAARVASGAVVTAHDLSASGFSVMPADAARRAG